MGLLHPLPIPKWKWEVISIDFITGLPKSRKQNDSIMVVVDKLRKSTNFIPLQSTYKVFHVETKNMNLEIFILHGIPKIVISNQDAKFNSNFCKEFFAGMGT